MCSERKKCSHVVTKPHPDQGVAVCFAVIPFFKLACTFGNFANETVMVDELKDLAQRVGDTASQQWSLGFVGKNLQPRVW